MNAVLFSHLAEAYVGIAGQENGAQDAHKRVRSINTAERYIERSYDGGSESTAVPVFKKRSSTN